MEKQIPMLFKADSTHLKLLINLAELQTFIWIDKFYLNDHIMKQKISYSSMLQITTVNLTIFVVK